MSVYPEGVSPLSPEIVGTVDGTIILSERCCARCGTVAEVEVRITTDGITAWESWECDVDECAYENESEYDASQLADPDREVETW